MALQASVEPGIYNGTLERSSTVQLLATEENSTNSTTDPDQQSADELSKATKESGTPKDYSLENRDSAAQAKVPPSDSHREETEELICHHSSNHPSLKNNDSAARAKILSSAAKATRPFLFLTQDAFTQEEEEATDEVWQKEVSAAESESESLFETN